MTSDLDTVEAILRDVLNAAGLPFSKIDRDTVANQTILSVRTDDGRMLIGSHGDVLHAIDHLVKKIIESRSPKSEAPSSEEEGPRFLIDVNDFRVKHIKELQTKALMMAERARSFQYDVELNPMSAYERLIVHTTLQDAPNVRTESQGEGRNRRVVIRYTSSPVI